MRLDMMTIKARTLANKADALAGAITRLETANRHHQEAIEDHDKARREYTCAESEVLSEIVGVP